MAEPERKALWRWRTRLCVVRSRKKIRFYGKQSGQRRAYIQQELGIVLHEDVLPMCDTVAYYRPLMLNREKVLKIKR